MTSEYDDLVRWLQRAAANMIVSTDGGAVAENIIENLKAAADAITRLTREKAEASHLSWNGFNIAGDRKSIDEVSRLMQADAMVDALRTRLASARAQGAEEMREACARVAESHGFIQARDTDWDGGVNFTRKFIAAAIRALLPKPTGE